MLAVGLGVPDLDREVGRLTRPSHICLPDGAGKYVMAWSAGRRFWDWRGLSIPVWDSEPVFPDALGLPWGEGKSGG